MERTDHKLTTFENKTRATIQCWILAQKGHDDIFLSYHLISKRLHSSALCNSVVPIITSVKADIKLSIP